MNKSATVRKSLKEKYSIIEECKADILGIYFVPYFANVFSYTMEDIAEQCVTYVAGLFRSIRFGVEEAHGLANLMQLNFLKLNGVIDLDPRRGFYAVDTNNFFEVIRELAKTLLVIEAEGDYSEAMKFIDIYGTLTSDTIESIEKLKDIPTDLNLTFSPVF